MYGAAGGADHAAHVFAVVRGPTEGAEIIGQVLRRGRFVGGLDRGAEVGDRGIDPEERRSARPGGAPAGGDCVLGGAGCGIGEGGKSAQAVRVDVGAMGDVGIAERRDMLGGEARDDLHHDISHGSVGLPLAGGDHAGFACRSAALVVLAAEIDVIGFDRRAGAAVRRRGTQHVPRTAARSWRGAGAYADTTRSGRTRPAGGRVRSPRFPAWCSSSDASHGTSGSAAVWYRP